MVTQGRRTPQGTRLVLDRGGAFGHTVRVIPRNDLLTSAAEPGVVAVA
jgi:glycogen phosphorylase